MGDGSRKRMRQQRRNAKRSKRQAKRLKKIYGDMSPEEIAEINRVAPELGGAAATIGPGGTQDNEPGEPGEFGGGGVDENDGEDFLESHALEDPIAVAAAFNKQYGRGSAGGRLYTEHADNLENFNNPEYAEKKGKKGGGGNSLAIAELINEDALRILDEFSDNWEKMKNQFEFVESAQQEHLFGINKFMKKFFGSKNHKDKDIAQNYENWESAENMDWESAENLDGDTKELLMAYLPVIIMAAVGWYLMGMGGTMKYAGMAVIAYAAYTAYKKHETYGVAGGKVGPREATSQESHNLKSQKAGTMLFNEVKKRV